MPPPHDGDASSVRGVLEFRARTSPAADFLIAPETGRRLNFGNLLRRSRTIAAFLAEQGIAAGAHVGLLLPNGLQATRLFVGLAAGGHVLVPLSLLAQAAQLAFILGHSDCRVVFVDPAREGVLRTGLASVDRDVRVFVVDPDQALFPGEPAEASWPAPEPAADTPALLMYTSGTTGQPKGVLLSHRNVLAGARFVSEAHGLDRTDRVLAVLPLYHINAQVVTVLAPLHHGGSLVMPRRFSAAAFWRLAREHGCTWLNVVPTMIAYLLQHDGEKTVARGADRLRFCRSASAPLPPAQQLAFEQRFGVGIIETMGLTETAAPVLANPLEPSARKLGSPGRAVGSEARVIDPDSGAEQPVGVTGEIVVRGENVTAAYYKAPEETAMAFTADGWLRTGDLGYCDEDGFYFITGRRKELIIKGGENIAPREIDEVLLAHPLVLEAAAVGVPDPLYGQQIVAGVVMKPGEVGDEIELIEFCCHRLGRFKTPQRILLLDELPKGPSGKLQRLRLLNLITGCGR